MARNGSSPYPTHQSRASSRWNASEAVALGEVWRARDGQTGTEVALKSVTLAAWGRLPPSPARNESSSN